MYALYIANKNYSSWSLRPWVLMKALGIPFEERLVVFQEGSNWQPFRSFSPAGLVPCLHDGRTVVWDSLGIAEYLAERHPGVWPAASGTRAWARCAAAEMHSGFSVLRNICTMNCGLRIRLREVSPALQRNLDRVGELWNEGLDRFGGPFLAGAAFTAVDAFYAPVAFRVQTYDLRLGGAANGYASRLLALQPMQEWYAAALKETWREKAHEAEALEVGAVLQDLRAKA
ncbi:MAG: glutathione S-transferase family protein [Chromatiales bacterium]|nr:glutathione S-transferase family protein [Chromatiales bacterium]